MNIYDKLRKLISEKSIEVHYGTGNDIRVVPFNDLLEQINKIEDQETKQAKAELGIRE